MLLLLAFSPLNPSFSFQLHDTPSLFGLSRNNLASKAFQELHYSIAQHDRHRATRPSIPPPPTKLDLRFFFFFFFGQQRTSVTQQAQSFGVSSSQQQLRTTTITMADTADTILTFKEGDDDKAATYHSPHDN